jgi:tetratricopeptide (TPR) repeat protein
MAGKLTFRQLVLSILALVADLGHKEIGARVGLTPSSVADYLGRKRKTELDDSIYGRLLSAFRRGRAAATIVEACLEALNALGVEIGLTADELAAVEREVLTGSRLMRQLLIAAFRKSREDRAEEAYPNAFEARLARRQAEEHFAELKRLSPRSRLAVVRLSPNYQSWAMVEQCCEAAVEEGSRDLKQSAAWARLALALAKWMRGPEGWQRRLRGYALAHWANLLKVRGDLPTADIRLEEAKRLWEAGSDPAGLLDPGRLFDIEGSLRRAQRRFDEALSCFDQAIHASRFPERALMMKGTTYEVMGDYEQAIAAYLVAKPLVERRGNPRLIYMLHFNIAATCCNVGFYGQAAELLGQVRDQIAARGDRIEMIRLKWLEGRIHVGLGSREEALHLLAQARESFEAEEKFYDVALALLEEGAVLLEENRTQEVKELTRELPKVFAAKGVHREALAALKVFQEAVEREAATAELARRILSFLFRARFDQGLQFES